MTRKVTLVTARGVSSAAVSVGDAKCIRTRPSPRESLDSFIGGPLTVSNENKRSNAWLDLLFFGSCFNIQTPEREKSDRQPSSRDAQRDGACLKAPAKAVREFR